MSRVSILTMRSLASAGTASQMRWLIMTGASKIWLIISLLLRPSKGRHPRKSRYRITPRLHTSTLQL